MDLVSKIKEIVVWHVCDPAVFRIRKQAKRTLGNSTTIARSKLVRRLRASDRSKTRQKVIRRYATLSKENHRSRCMEPDLLSPRVLYGIQSIQVLIKHLSQIFGTSRR